VVRLEPVARSKKNCELLLAGTLIRGDDADLWSIDLHHSAIPPQSSVPELPDIHTVLCRKKHTPNTPLSGLTLVFPLQEIAA
jgi:hypothetical protein